MLIFFEQKLVFLAVPKTGTTGIEAGLKGFADIVYRRRPALKHTPARKYRAVIAPFLREAYQLEPETFAVIRDPVDQLRSWFKYRHKPSLDGTAKSTKGVSFDQFVQGFMSDSPPPYAKLGTQGRFLTDRHGAVLVDHLFAYERPLALHDFLQQRFGDSPVLPVKNVSPQGMDTTLTPDTEARLRLHLAGDFALHAQVLNAGHWQRPA